MGGGLKSGTEPDPRLRRKRGARKCRKRPSGHSGPCGGRSCCGAQARISRPCRAPRRNGGSRCSACRRRRTPPRRSRVSTASSTVIFPPGCGLPVHGLCGCFFVRSACVPWFEKVKTEGKSSDRAGCQHRKRVSFPKCDKPDSVRAAGAARGAHSSIPPQRDPRRSGVRHTRNRGRATRSPILPCTGLGLSCLHCYLRSGGLLPPLFTLTPGEPGAVCFLRHFPSRPVSRTRPRFHGESCPGVSGLSSRVPAHDGKTSERRHSGNDTIQIADRPRFCKRQATRRFVTLL